MMDIYYLTRMNFSANRAHVYNTARTCEFLNSQEGTRLTLIDADGSLKLIGRDDFFLKHQVSQEFDIISIKNRAIFPGWRNFNVVKKINSSLSIFALLLFLCRHRKKYQTVYFRDGFFFLPVMFVKFILGKKVFFEIHAVLHSQISQLIMEWSARVSDGLIAISLGLRDYFLRFNKNILVSFCSAAEPERFDRVSQDKDFLRHKLNLPIDKIIIGYSGNLTRTGNNDPYGIDDIIRGVELLDERFALMLIGGRGDGGEGLKELVDQLKMSARVIFVPWMTREQLAEYILASDILVIPACGAQIGNSPTKMFEYLVSGRPIVAANTQAIAEVLTDGQNCLLVDYKNPLEWQRAINKLVENPSLAQALVAQAKIDGAKYSWVGRGRAIADFIIKSV